MRGEPVPEAIVSTLLAAGLVYPASPVMASIAILVGIPVLIFLLPQREGAPIRRALRGGAQERLLTVTGLSVAAFALLLISYTRPSIALSVFTAFMGSVFLTLNLFRRLYAIYSSSTSQNAARVLATLTTGLFMAAYYLGFGFLLNLITVPIDLPEGGI